MVNVNLQREQFTTLGMHINRQENDVTARYLATVTSNVFIKSQCASPIILKWREDHHDGDVNVVGTTPQKQKGPLQPKR
jgi:hypothetical protein